MQRTTNSFYQSTLIARYFIKGRRDATQTTYLWITAVLLFIAIIFAKQLQAQKYTLINPAPVSGLITDAKGHPLPGIKISTLPQYSEAYSDKNGAFTIAISRFTRSLQFEKTGYATRKIILKKASSPLKIQMQLLQGKDRKKNASVSEPLLDKSIVIGYGNQRPSRITGSTQTAPARFMTRGNNAIYYSPNIESYVHQKENGFKSAKSSPLSTFSIDVDKASYSNVRRFINEGHLPPADAVRTEELINYFDYHYKQPTGKDPVNIQTELSSAPWNPEHYLLKIGLQAKKVATDQLPPSNLVFLIDVSGSMAAANKLPLLITSFKMLTDQLREQDYVSIVTYAGDAQNVLAPTSGADKKTIKKALDQLSAYGSTNGAGGLEKAYAMAEQHFRKEGNNRIILASDGDFNVGPNSIEALEALIAEKRKTGTFLSVLGFGMGNFKDDKMETLADKGNGNYAYIDNSAEARRVLLKEFGGTLFTVAKDVKVQVEFNPAIVKAYRLIGYENRALADEDFNRDTVDAGEMGSGSSVTALYEIIPQGVKDAFTPSMDTLRYMFSQRTKNGSALHQELGLVKIRYKEPHSSKSKLMRSVIQDSRTPLQHTSPDFQLAAAAASWGMLLKNSPYRQAATYDQVADLLKKPLESDKSGQIGGFLNLVQTSQALVGNEASSIKEPSRPPIHLRPRPRPRPYPVPQPFGVSEKDAAHRLRVSPVTKRSAALRQALQGRAVCVETSKNH